MVISEELYVQASELESHVLEAVCLVYAVLSWCSRINIFLQEVSEKVHMP